ncbi:MAG: hypothetical protein FJ368_06870 [Pelagibacterales bacterium]|nr:hypothetical protein [Pelagibacterales bacterium]
MYFTGLNKAKIKILFCGKLWLFLLCLCSSSCEKKNVINEAFKEKYGQEIERIKNDRTPTQDVKIGTKYNFESPTFENTTKASENRVVDPEQQYANVDVQEYSEVKPKQFFPDSNVYVEGKASQALPDNIFDLSYNTTLSPPFRPVKSAFDLVQIPSYDYYGVRTALEEKQYTIVGNNYLQKNIDEIGATRSKEDIEISKILIAEQKKLKRQYRMEKIFGQKDQIDDSKNKKEKKSDDKKESADKMPETEKVVEENLQPVNKQNSESGSNVADEKINKIPDVKVDSKKTENNTIIDKILKIN